MVQSIQLISLLSEALVAGSAAYCAITVIAALCYRSVRPLGVKDGPAVNMLKQLGGDDGLDENFRTIFEGQRSGYQAERLCASYQHNVAAGQLPERVLRGWRFVILAPQCSAFIRRGIERGARTIVDPPALWCLVPAPRLFPHWLSALRQDIRSVERGRPAALAPGGGASVEAANCGLVVQNGIAIRLDCPFDRVRRNAGDASVRPLARDPQGYAALDAIIK